MARTVPAIVGISLDTTTLAGNIRTIRTLISTPKGPYIFGQNGTHYRWNTATNDHCGWKYKDRLYININTKSSLY